MPGRLVPFECLEVRARLWLCLTAQQRRLLPHSPVGRLESAASPDLGTQWWGLRVKYPKVLPPTLSSSQGRWGGGAVAQGLDAP